MHVSHEHHFKLTYRFMQLQAIGLVEAMKEAGITDREVQRKVVTDYLFKLAMDWDQYFIKDPTCGDRKHYPIIGFRDNEDVEATTEVVLPDGKDAFHETMPFGVIDSLFSNDVDIKEEFNFVYGNSENEINFSQLGESGK